ncbi:alpha/beta fold hydrolase [Synechococcales cyanobacterium C]|uniref:Monoacylglycerol lipase n=1 Tax=Petrachloros mirabilis ULC683 TaxID=2781853 RepID=A0A8K1ZX69_9CYAN|nr:alpha/beta hydrolase [Petrachloros mirabilis]NCJ06824.1 alpha/beta fold hydrolase [Petrachloros mirabilis ULC683]
MNPSEWVQTAHNLETYCQGFFAGAGNCSLFYQRWLPAIQLQAVLVIVHGLGGHSGWHSIIATHFVPRQYGVYTFDLRGHGRSPGLRGHINHWSEFRADLECFVQFVQQEHPHIPIVAVGHSLGGTILLDYVLHHPQVLQGIIVTAPAIGAVAISPVKLALGRLLSRIWPQFSLSTGFDLTCSTRDPDVLAAYQQDPLRHRLGTARLSTEFQQAVNRIQSQAASLQVPILLLHGTADCVVPISGSRQFFDHLTLAQKVKREYTGAYHDLYNDLSRDQVLTDIEDWLTQRVPRTGD